jgi:transcriptional regulator with XRE-family HTH domain
VKITSSLTDDAVQQELGDRLASARLNQNLSQAHLAARAGVSKRTVERLEAGSVATQLSAFIRICRALGLLDAFDALIPAAAPSPMTLMTARGRTRRRASAVASTPSTPWRWGDDA